AAPEQYTNRSQLGPWSDIYSIGATMYACLSRSSPQAADARLKKDSLVPAVKLGKDIYSDNLLKIIDSCLALDHLQRPQSIYALQKSLQNDRPTEAQENEKRNGIMGKIINILQKEL